MLTPGEFIAARDRAAQIFAEAGIMLTDAERSAIEIADFGLSKLEETGLEIVVYVNTVVGCARRSSPCSRARSVPSTGIRRSTGRRGRRRPSAAVLARFMCTPKASPRRTRMPWAPATGRSPRGAKSSRGPATSTRFPRHPALVSGRGRGPDRLPALHREPRLRPRHLQRPQDRSGPPGSSTYSTAFAEGRHHLISDGIPINRRAADLHIDGAEPAELADSGLRESLYRRRRLIRRFEERVYRLFLEGEIPGTLHQYQGQEAVAVAHATP